MKGYLYILKSPNCKRPYLGSSSNLENRIIEHNKGTTKSTKNKGPWSIDYYFEFDNLQKAKKIETIIKNKKIKITKENIKKIIESLPNKTLL
mgnify:CR=1 FL=1